MKKQIGIFTALLFAVSTLMVGCKAEVHTHTFAEEWSSDETNHWHAATCEHKDEVINFEEHSFGDWTITKEPTEEAEGSREKSCTVCEYTVPEVIEKLEHTHKFATDWTEDETNHWHAATCEHTDEVSEKATHSFGPWNVVQVATKEEVGIRRRFCLICNYKDETKIPKVKVPEMVEVKGATVTGALPAWLGESAYGYYKGVFIKDRTVTLSNFYMGKYEVTQEEYESVMAGQTVTVNEIEYELESNPSYCSEGSTSYTLFSGDEQAKRPVEGVTWYDAVWYCNALSAKEGLAPAYNIEVTEVKQVSGKTGYYIYGATVTLNKEANGYRLPTEAEWEYAARGGDPNAADWNYTFSGADKADGTSYSDDKNSGLDSVGWYGYNNITGVTGDSKVTSNVEGRGTHQVGKKAANALGLYDMSGNVWEWCYDWAGTVNTGTETDPTGASAGTSRFIRGGSWGNYSDSCLVSLRTGDNPYRHNEYQGFRLVRQAN